MKITQILGRMIYDSRGYPTVETDVILEDGSWGRAAVPSGASTGSREAVELRDGGESYGGKGVATAVDHVNGEIATAVVGKEAWDQFALDDLLCKLDGTENKSRLGANATLAVSLAVAKAMAASSKQLLYQYIAHMTGNKKPVLPIPMMNILNGGKHAAGSTDIQEFMIIPTSAETFADAMRMGSEVFHSLGKLLGQQGLATTVGDEGGYAPAISGNERAMQLIDVAVGAAGYQLGYDISLAIDVASSELTSPDGYVFTRENRHFSSDDLIAWYEELVTKYPISSIEDGLSEDDWQGWPRLQDRLGKTIQLVGDDLLVTNTKLLEKAIEVKAANAILIKPNQIGTLTETIRAVQMAQKAGWRTIMSHRSGETEDTTIAHLAVGLGTGQIKTGSLSRSERLAKYNELLRIGEESGLPMAHPFSK